MECFLNEHGEILVSVMVAFVAVITAIMLITAMAKMDIGMMENLIGGTVWSCY